MTPPRTKLQALAAILLEEDAARFQLLCDQLLDDPEGFERAGHADTYSLSREEMENAEHPLRPAFLLLMEFAYAEDYSVSEPDADGFELWVAARAHALGRGSMDLDFVDDWVEANTGEPNFLSNYFKLLGRHLAPLGLDLIFLNVGDDTYRPFVLRGGDLPRLPHFDDADDAAFGWLRVERWDATTI
jgi:hypothetical protein